jgi:hypothetical protein
MIHRLLKRKQPSNLSENATNPEFSLGFSANQSMDHALEKIIEDITQLSHNQEEKQSLNIEPHTIPHDRGFNSPPLALSPTLFTKKTISKNKTFRGLNNPLKVPQAVQRPQSPAPVITKNSVLINSITGEKQFPRSYDRSQTKSFSLPLNASNSTLQASRISIAKELLKAAASCQMISIQEAHSMGSKITLSNRGLMLPTLAELLHRNQDSVQKSLLLKANKTIVPIDFFTTLIGNQTVQKYHSLLIPYKIIPLFNRGNSLTILAEHPFLVSLVETILKENLSPVSWIHFIPASLSDLESFS